MAWEWVGPVATGVVGVAGIAATVWTQRQAQKNGMGLATQARDQQRKQVAYEKILQKAIETTEFVGYADVIWVRDAEPPDVDYKNYDLWMMVDLYASDAVRARYHECSDAVHACREVLDDVPEGTPWYEMDKVLKERFTRAKEHMDTHLNWLMAEARTDLVGRQ